MKPVAQILTADDLWRMPDKGQRHELVRGELRTMTPAGFEHGAIGFNLGLALGNFVKSKKLGIVVSADTGFMLETDPDTVRAPDVAFVRQERVAASGLTRKFFPGAPDLAVEVISPSDILNEVDEKVEHWLQAGTQLVWVVNPRQKTVTVYQKDAHTRILTEKDQLEGDPVLPGFQLAVAEIFA